MARYDWRSYAERDWRFRYPDDLNGALPWRSQPDVPTVDSLGGLHYELRTSAAVVAPPPVCPSVFISHRRNDATLGERVAFLATTAQFDFWLDVLDPDLQAATAATALPLDVQELLMACIIDTALMNATHVVALVTPNTPGSWWVPYEYGRVRPHPQSLRAACWRHRDSRTLPVQPSYLMLGAVFDAEADVETWLARERQAFTSCSGVKPWPPTLRVPGALPD